MSEPTTDPQQPDGDLGDMLQELRILLQGTQVMTAFLIILPFSEYFNAISPMEKRVYLATFICSVTSLVLFTAPAAHHRIVRPLRDREGFKRFASRMMILGLVALSLAWVLATQLVVSEVFGRAPSLVAMGFVTLIIGLAWWIVPLLRKNRD
jgi:accessory gene regulator protein AgrB